MEGILLFLVAVCVVVGRQITGNANINKIAKEDRWGDPNYDKFEQQRIFDYYLKENPFIHNEQEILTTWELYQKAQMEHRKNGYKWDASWDRFTPSPDKKEYVNGTMKHWKEERRKNHRKGENEYKQNLLFKSWICGYDDEPASEDYLFIDMTQYEIYEFVKCAYNGQILTKYKNDERFVEKAKKIRYRVCGNYHYYINEKGEKVGYLNEYGEPNIWYDDLMPFIPKKDYIPYPSKHYRETHKKGETWGLNEQMADTIRHW